jgi:hypothetical protein
MEAILDSFTDEVFREIMVGTEIKWDKVVDDEMFVKTAVHCCLNGPVGVKTKTGFPGVKEEFSINDLYESNLSNKMWKNFCRGVAQKLLRDHPDLVRESQQVKLHEQVWPLYDN